MLVPVAYLSDLLGQRLCDEQDGNVATPLRIHIERRLDLGNACGAPDDEEVALHAGARRLSCPIAFAKSNTTTTTTTATATAATAATFSRLRPAALLLGRCDVPDARQ